MSHVPQTGTPALQGGEDVRNQRMMELKAQRKKLWAAEAAIAHEMDCIKENCKHVIVKHVIAEDCEKAVCDECGEDFGWWCPASPNHICDYDADNEDYCKYCNQPDERN